MTTYNVELPVKKAGRKHVSRRVVPVVLPHELIFSLYHEKPERFNEVFWGNHGDGKERLDQFWKMRFSMQRGCQIILVLAPCARTTCTAFFVACTGTMLPTTRKDQH